jgi:hypothetical protein
MTSNLRRSWALCLALALLAGISPSLLRAKNPDPKKPFALIFGTVFAADGSPAQGIKIKIRRADQKKAKWELRSDSHGEFAQRFPAGKADYIVWADLKDKQAAEKTQVTVHIENDERRDIALHLNQ